MVDRAASDVTVIGLGAMGTTLAKTFLAKGRAVTVWNRTIEKAEPLAELGANVADSAAAAFESSPLIVMCVLNYEGANAILAEVGVDSAIAGKVLAQLSTASVDESIEQEKWISERGGIYLDGGILAYPRTIGEENTVILYSGPKEAFDQHGELLADVAGSHRLIGDGSAATVTYLALWGYYFAALGGFFETAAFVGARGASIAGYADLIPVMTESMLNGVVDGARRVVGSEYGGDQASINVHVDGVSTVVDEMERAGVRANITDAFLDYCREAHAKGDADRDVASVFKVINS